MNNETIRIEFEVVHLHSEEILYTCPVCAATVEDWPLSLIKHKGMARKKGRLARVRC